MELNLVLDTNVLIASIPKKSPSRWLWNKFLSEEIEISITTEILLEYEEILNRFWGVDASATVLQILDSAVNVNFITRYFHWELIKADPDDNKFVDCAVASNANFIITKDRHFKELLEVDFPKIEVITPSELKNILDEIK
ncbi:MAG: putative toxin-antitoxin system toxin component, PIN family [Saprospiraceae bacterium]